jgi:hypothetical protein
MDQDELKPLAQRILEKYLNLPLPKTSTANSELYRSEFYVKEVIDEILSLFDDPVKQFSPEMNVGNTEPGKWCSRIVWSELGRVRDKIEAIKQDVPKYAEMESIVDKIKAWIERDVELIRPRKRVSAIGSRGFKSSPHFQKYKRG